MPLKTLEDCLNTVYSEGPIDNQRLNDLYTKTSTKPLAQVDKKGVVGFKMRFVNPHNPLHQSSSSALNKVSKKLFQKVGAGSFKTMMLDVLKKNNVVVFFAVRQDLLRWGISKYHGDGTGKPGHLQFQLANGKLSKQDIGKLHVECPKLEKIIDQCESIHNQKRQLMNDVKAAGIDAYPLCYEDFLTDKPQYLKRLFRCIDLEVPQQQIDSVLQNEAYFKKVHSDDLSEFVVNHEEVMNTIGSRFYPWS